MRLLLDELYPGRLAGLLRADGHDVLAVVEVSELVGGPDDEVARWALDAGRRVVTENVADFARMDPESLAGLLLMHPRRWPRTPTGIARLHAALSTWLTDPAQADDVPVSWL